MAKIVKDSSGQFIAVKEDGTRVPVPPSWVSQSEALPRKSSMTPGQEVAQAAGLSPEGGLSPDGETEDPMIIRPTQGVGVGERFLLKNMANHENVVSHLEGWGYEVKPYGNHPVKMQYAVRPKGTNGVWQPLDPEGFDWQDLLDFAGDVPGFVGATLGGILGAPAAGASGPGALAVESAAVGLGSAAGEAAREAAGVAIGLEKTVSPGQIGFAGAAGAATPVAAKLVAPITRALGRPLAYGFEKVGDVIRMTGLRLMGAKGIPSMPLKEADAILRNAAGKTILPIPEQAKAVQAVVKTALTADWPEAAKANQLLAAARDAGAKMDFNPIIEGIENAAGAIERRAEGAARPLVTDAEAQMARMKTGAPAGKPTFEEFQQTNLGQRTRAMDFKRTGGREAETAAGESTDFGGTTPPDRLPGAGDFERRMRAQHQGKAFEGLERRGVDTLPVGGKTQPIRPNEGAGLTSGAKRAKIAEYEEEFGKPGAFGAPGDVEEKLSSGAARAEFRNPGLRKELLSFAGRLAKRFSDQGFRLSEVPVDFGNVVVQDLQALARKGGAYKDNPIEDAFINVMKDAAAQARIARGTAMPAELRQEFAETMTSFEAKTKLAQAVLNKVSDPAATEAWLRDIYGNSNSSGLRYIQQLEDRFGMKILEPLREAQAKEIIGQGNIQNFAQKHPYLAAAAIFHPETALPAVGGLAVAPAAGKGIAAAGRAVGKATELGAEAAARAARSPAAKAAAVRILQDNVAGMGKGIASESQASNTRKPKRVTRLF